MNWLHNFRTTVLLLAISSLIKPTVGIVLQTSKEKGYFECEYSNLPFLSFEWGQVPQASMGLTTSLIVYQPSTLYGEVNAKTWYKSTNASSMLDKEEEKIKFNINAGTVDVLDSRTGIFETVSISDSSRILSYIPHFNGSSSPLEISLPKPGFYCVQAYYELTSDGNYSIPYTYYDPTTRENRRLRNYYGPNNRTAEIDKQFFQEEAQYFLPKLNFYDSQYRAMYENVVWRSRTIFLTCILWPSSLVLLAVCYFFIKRSSELKAQAVFYASFGFASTFIYALEWSNTAARYAMGPSTNEMGVFGILSLALGLGMNAALLYALVIFSCLYCLIDKDKNDRIDPGHLWFLLPLASVFFGTQPLAELKFLFIGDPNLVNGTIIGTSGRSFQDATLIVTAMSWLMVLAFWARNLFFEKKLGDASWLAELQRGTDTDMRKLARQTCLLYKIMFVFCLILVGLGILYNLETRNNTSITALDGIADFSLIKLLYVNQDFCVVLVYMWTGFALLVPMMFEKEIGDIPLANLKSDSEGSEV